MAYNKRYRTKFTKTKKLEKLPRVHRNWSDYQVAIFNEVANGTGNIHVDALAGTGKTSTIVESFYHLPSNKSALMVAFNKSIQIELDRRAPESVQVSTLHSLGYKSCLKAFPKMSRKIDQDKALGYIKAVVGDESDDYDLRSNLQQMVSLCKGYLAESKEEMDEIMDRHGIDSVDKTREEFIGIVNGVLRACKKDTNRIDFDDMIWFTIVHNLRLVKTNFVFIDESQDLNKAQIELALRSITNGGRIVSVGDEHQCIYTFRGADERAIQNIVDRCNSKRLPLSVTYRCSKAIVRLAQELVPELEACDGASEGLVESITSSKLEEMVRPGDFVLSRVNAPLIRWCLTFLKAGIPANIQGRDLARNLMAMVRKSKKDTVIDFIQWISEWREIECARLEAINRDSDIIRDKAECLEVICEGCKDLDEVMFQIDKLFHDGDNTKRVMLSSTHKAKGLERDRVFLLRDTYNPGRSKEESNLLYVAITRAKQELYLVDG